MYCDQLLCDTDLSLARLMYMKADTFWNEVDVQYYAKFPSFVESGRSVNVAGYHCKPYYCKPAPNFRKDICVYVYKGGDTVGFYDFECVFSAFLQTLLYPKIFIDNLINNYLYK